MSGDLSVKYQRFVDEYLVDLNATQAAIRAGYSPRNARNQGSKLLTKPDIQDAVAAGAARRSQRTGITADNVVIELAKIAFANMTNYMTINSHGQPIIDLTTMTPDQAAAIRVYSKDTKQIGDDGPIVTRASITLQNKVSALNSLARHLQMFTPKPDRGRRG